MVEFSHLGDDGKVKMVDISEKDATLREARARGRILINKDLFMAIKENSLKKGPVLETAKIAGILGAKNTHLLIPLTHPLFIEHIDLSFTVKSKEIEITSQVKLKGKTGAEMEALTAVSIAALTIYDMAKSVDKNMKIMDISLIEKKGGKSGHYIAK
ncbi:MAG: cyclic pyranopterin monophosphate synthase MoaC [Thermodesulfobacteriota bacterium]|nr:cyclic pyranopterin monophosphate synthase MoaC [Thermodesulfobacteriota bacterium]